MMRDTTVNDERYKSVQSCLKYLKKKLTDNNIIK